MSRLADLQTIDVEGVAKAIELDADQSIRGLRESLMQAKRGEFAAIHTPEQIIARTRGRPVGSTAAKTKVQTSLRLSPEVFAYFKAMGRGWQTQIDIALQQLVSQKTAFKTT